jgi:Putative beta barrel porin-7 (BBP7)
MKANIRETLCTLLATLTCAAVLAAEPPSPNATVRPGLRTTTQDVSAAQHGSTAPPYLNESAIDPAVEPLYCSARTIRLYGGADYLMWWVKGAPLSVPLVSTGPIATTHHGLLGPPAENGADSTVLYGAGHSPAQGGKDIQDFPLFSGGRLTLGLWLDSEQRYAIEGGGFFLARRGAGYQAHGDSNGNPVLGVPVYNSIPYDIGPMTIFRGEDSLPFSLPDDPSRARGAEGVITGGIKISNNLRLWGAEAAGVINFQHSPTWQFSGLVGFRYLDLSETFNLTSDIQGVSGLYANQSGVVSDTFQTRNQFYGGMIGLRMGFNLPRLSADLTVRAALGSTREVQNVWGGFTSINFPNPGFNSGPEGIFAQPANEGRRSANKFSVVPDAQLKLTYAITSWMQASAGYDFLYFTNVIRPGDQINRELPKGQTFNQANPFGSSTTSPAKLFQTTDFFAHGWSFGLQFNY